MTGRRGGAHWRRTSRRSCSGSGDETPDRLLLGTEEDWSTSFERLAGRVGSFTWRGDTHALDVERVTNEPFDLRYRPRYALVIDRLGWWYALPREWLKKVVLMDDVYVLNNPFTFQAMEKHSAYCAMMRLGLKVPDTWLIPHKQPPANERFQTTAERYNLPFDLTTSASRSAIRSTSSRSTAASGAVCRARETRPSCAGATTSRASS